MNVIAEIWTVIFFAFQLGWMLPLLLPFLRYLIQLLHFGKQRSRQSLKEEADYAIIVTAYEEVAQIPHVVESILRMNYSNFLVYIVADKCDISELTFIDDRVIVLRPEETLSSNIRSHFYAIDRFRRKHERLTIIDSDNLVAPEYINELNRYFDEGFVAVQGVRKAKNLNTSYACLDEAGDMYYRYVDRTLLFRCGSSASLAGSGMAFLTSCYERCLRSFQYKKGAGFDKLLQYAIVNDDFRIAFAEQAIVYDEKTAKSGQLVKQRARWINTWFTFFLLGAKLLGKSVIRRSLNQFVFALMLLRPPLFLVLALALLMIIADMFLMPYMVLVWMVAMSVFGFVFWKGLRHFSADARIYRALLAIPYFMFYQLIALFKARRANELSVATKHEQKIDINELKSL